MSGGTLTVNGFSSIGYNSSDGFAGGGVFVEGTATFLNAELYGNDAYRGGAIFNQSGDLTVASTSFDYNSTKSGAGAGIYGNTSSSTTVVSSIFTFNTATANGGALYFNNATADIANSYIGRNSGYYSGGAELRGTTVATFTNTTIAENSADNGGGAISVLGSSTLNLYNSTLTGNYLTAGYDGGAIANIGTLNINNSIVAGNFDAAEVISDINQNGTLNSNGVNIFSQAGLGDAQDIFAPDVATIFAVIDTVGGRQFGRAEENGGSVHTVLINRDGVAVDAGDDAALPADASVTWILTLTYGREALPIDATRSLIGLSEPLLISARWSCSKSLSPQIRTSGTTRPLAQTSPPIWRTETAYHCARR